MTKQLEQVIQTIRTLPEQRQNELAELLIDAVQPTFSYSPEQLAKIDESIAQADAGEFASADQVEQIFGRYRAV